MDVAPGSPVCLSVCVVLAKQTRAISGILDWLDTLSKVWVFSPHHCFSDFTYSLAFLFFPTSFFYSLTLRLPPSRSFLFFSYVCTKPLLDWEYSAVREKWHSFVTTKWQRQALGAEVWSLAVEIITSLIGFTVTEKGILHWVMFVFW